MITEQMADSQTRELRSLGESLIAQNFVLFEGRGARYPKYTMQEAMKGLENISPLQRASTAVMLKNTHKWLYEELSETTRTTHVGDFEKYAFQVVRAVFPNLIAHQTVSVQPMAGPTSLLFYLQYLYARTKGSAKAGTDIHENPNAFYSSEHIDIESVGTAGSTNYTGTLDYTPVRPGTVTMTDGSQVVTDDGQGNLVGDVGAGTNTVNYQTGAFDVTFAATTAGDVVAEYDYNLEANEKMGELDLSLVSAPVVARARKIKASWSIEATHDLKSQHGMEAELELVGAQANELKFEVDREIIDDLRRVASVTSVPAEWGKDLPTGISYTEHKLSFLDTLTWMSNGIYKKTQRAKGSWIIAGIDVMNIIETLPGFKADGVLTGRGVYRAGVLNNRWVVFADSYLPDDEFIMGYKGEAMYETGYIWAPYIPLYTTPTVQLDDFKARRAVASRYGKKTVNSKFFINGKIVTGKSGPQPLVYA